MDLVGFEVLSAVTVMNSTRIFWDMTSCRPVKFHRRFEGHTCSFVRVEESAKQEAISNKQKFIFNPEDRVSTFLQNVGEHVYY
jgi:hypothetical protein